jgi:hypothetical protein
MAIPEVFCWTKYGSEAGEGFSQILERKERERQGNGGTFLWGIGNALGPSISILLEKSERPRLVFSPIRSAPRHCDVAPDYIARWTRAETMSGDTYLLPTHSVVTSRSSAQGPSRAHYALVCYSPRPLQLEPDPETLAFGELRNLLSGRPLGASQVTAVVSRNVKESIGSLYRATLMVELCAPYFVRLKEPAIGRHSTQVEAG